MERLLVIDTETGGLDPLVNSILSLGAVVWEDGAIKDEIEILIVEPEINAEPGALKVNRINLAVHRRTGLPPAEAMSRLNAFLGKNFARKSPKDKIPLVGHNIYFDIGFLQRLCRFAKFDFEATFSHRVLDTAAIIRFLILANVLPLSGAGSTEAFEYFQIKFDPAKRHTALEDARATAELLSKLIDAVTLHKQGKLFV